VHLLSDHGQVERLVKAAPHTRSQDALNAFSPLEKDLQNLWWCSEESVAQGGFFCVSWPASPMASRLRCKDVEIFSFSLVVTPAISLEIIH